MSTKSEIIEILEMNRGKAISGQELANTIGVSRAAVWKSIKLLQEEGYKITATTNKGYVLLSENDILSEQGVRMHLPDQISGTVDIRVYNSIDSTNNEAKRIITSGSPLKKPIVIIANEQTAGRGRRGREFFSPPNTGIYMSFAMVSNSFSDIVLTITLAAGVALCNTIEAVTSEQARIKWVNDVYVNSKKVGGILTEGITDFESGIVEAIVVGMGLNVTTTDFGDELSDIAGSIMEQKDYNITRNQIASRMIMELLKAAEQIQSSKESIMNSYRSRSFILGREIGYQIGDIQARGVALDINENGNLIVKHEDDSITILKAGEVKLLLHERGADKK